MGSYIAPSGMSKEQAWNEAKTLYGSNLNQSFVWNGQELNAGTGLPMNPTMSAGNNKMPTDVAKSQANLISANKPSGQGFTGLATKYADPTKKKVGKREVSLLQNDPPALMKNTDTIKLAGGWEGEADDTTMEVQSGNVRMHDDGTIEQLGGIAPLDEPVNVAKRVSDEDISSMLAGKEVVEGSLSTGALLADKSEQGGFLPDSLIKEIASERIPTGDSGQNFSEMYNKSIGTSKALPTSTMDRGLSFTPDLTSAGKGLMDVSGGTTGVGGLTAEGLAGEAAGGGLKDMLGKAGGMMSKAAPGIMAGLNILGEAGAMSARKKAIGSLGKSMADLETTMEQAITSKHAGYEAAEDAFQQGKGLVGKRLTDSMKGAFAGVQGSNIVTGSREKVKKNIRGQVRNQADMAVAGLETEMAKGKAASLTQSRSTRDKAKAAYAEAKAKQKELEQQQKMGPLKMAASVVSVVNPAAGMAMNAGLSLYDAYSS